VCGRYVSATSEPDLIGAYGVTEVAVREPIRPRWNVAPTDVVPMVRAGEGGGRVLASARWGLVPSWSADRSGAARLINARLETVADKPAFRGALRARRCLLPADGYYEWAADADRPGRRPYLLRSASGGGLAFAGLYETWRDPAAGGATLVTVTVVTTAATGAAASVHDRMPVLLPPDAWAAWLAPEATDPEAAVALARDAAGPPLVVTPANRLVGDVSNDGPHLLEPDPADEPAPTLF
jgi:putative SOS response-associated peptidase YedK